MPILSLEVLADNVPHVLASERSRMETMDEPERSEYRPGRAWLKPPTTAQVALYYDRRHGGLVGQGSVEIVRDCLEKLENVRTRRDGAPEDIVGPGASLLRHLRFSDIVDLGMKLAELADPDPEDFV